MHNCQCRYQCQYSIGLSVIFSVRFQECCLLKALSETISVACCQLPADRKHTFHVYASDAGADSRSCARGDKSGYFSSFTIQKCNPSFCAQALLSAKYEISSLSTMLQAAIAVADERLIISCARSLIRLSGGSLGIFQLLLYFYHLTDSVFSVSATVIVNYS